MGYMNRDVEVIEINDNQYLVIACDSCGAIGLKDLDMVKVPPYITGKLTARVALMEVMAVGAKPLALTAAICNESDPTGDEILKGIKDELLKSKSQGVPISISTEKNMLTRQTGLGVTAVGVCIKEDLKVGATQRGDFLYCLGSPMVGNEVKIAKPWEIVDYIHLWALMDIQGIHDIVPVGSQGIKVEGERLAETAGYTLSISNPEGLDIEKSAGPSTCILFTCPPGLPIPYFSDMRVSRIGKIE